MPLQIYFKCLTIAGLKWAEQQPWEFSLEMSEAPEHQDHIVMVLSTGSVCLTLCKNRHAVGASVNCSGRKVLQSVHVYVH